MEFVLESPVIKWFLAINWDEMLAIQSPVDLYCNSLPVLSTVVSSVSVGFLCRRLITAYNIPLQLVAGLAGSYLFLRYIWFHGFIHYRRLCNQHLDIDVDFCRRFFEPGLAAVVAAILAIVAWRRKSKTEANVAVAKASSTVVLNVGSNGDGTQRNSNNSASGGDKVSSGKNYSSSGRDSSSSSTVNTSFGGIKGGSGADNRQETAFDIWSRNDPSLLDPEENEDALHPFGQLLYCQRCGQVVYESVADPFPPPLAPLSRPSIPKALVMRPEDGSPPTLRHLRCPNCVEIKMNAAGLRGLSPRNVSFAVGQHNLTDTRPKSILRGP